MSELPVYRFRLRWILEPGRSLQDFEGPAVVLLPGIGRCEIKPIDAATQNEGHSLALTGPPTNSRDQAMQDGELALGSLLQTTLRLGFAVLLQPRKPGGLITQYGMEWAGQQFPDIETMYRDNLGLTVFEEKGETRFLSMGNIGISVTTKFNGFVDEWITETHANLSRRNLIAYELYASSRFESSSRARFLLLVMAVESLAIQKERPPEERVLIAEFVEKVAASDLSEIRRTTLSDGLRILLNASIGESCRNLIDLALKDGVVKDHAAGTHFRNCYRIRSQIVHSGKTPSPSELTNQSNRLEITVRELVGWALQQQSSEPCELWPSEFTRFMPDS